MLQRTSTIQHHCQARRAARVRLRSFHAWSGNSLSRYFHNKSQEPDPEQPDSSRGQERADPCSESELSKRREQLQELLRRLEVERVNRKKTG